MSHITPRVSPHTRSFPRSLGTWSVALLLGGLAMATVPPVVSAQVPIRDLVSLDQDVPWRLLGYGLVVGLDGTGDRTIAGYSGGQTVQSVANLLRRFDIEVPAELLRTRNVAAVLVTAEVSPFLRPGGRFEVQVASLGDASSLRGGLLWSTPLTTGSRTDPVATAQGAVVMSDGFDGPAGYAVETSARLPGGGLLEAPLPAASFAAARRLSLSEPDLGTALLIADAINQTVGDGTATVEDPGSVALTLPDPAEAARVLGQIQQLTVTPQRSARLVIDGRDGTVVAGSGLTVGDAVVSHRGITLSIGSADTPAQGAAPEDGPERPDGLVQVAAGVSVQDVASALHQVGASPSAIATIFAALRDVGAVSADVTIR